MELLEGASEWPVPEKKWQITTIFGEVFPSREPLSIWGEFTLIFPSGMVKPFPTLILVERVEVASMYGGGPRIPGLVAEQASRTMDAGARRCWSRFGLYIFCL
jgi:hypothetical protein